MLQDRPFNTLWLIYLSLPQAFGILTLVGNTEKN